MAWYNPGGGAGVWDAAKVDTDLRNIIAQLCHAVNERELYRSAAVRLNRAVPFPSP